jgi:hypothetical protein
MGIVNISYKYQGCPSIFDDAVSAANKFEYFVGGIRDDLYPY